MTPFEILDVEPTASDQEVKEAYLRKVRQYPPETHPARFRLLSDAYSRIATEAMRLDYTLFSMKSPLHSPMDVLSKRFLFWERKPMDGKAFQRHLQQSAGAVGQ